MLCTPMERKDTQGWFIRPKRELKNRITRLAKEYGRPSGNQLVLEIIEQYLTRWEESEKAKKRLLEDFDERLDLMLKQPMIEAKAEEPKVRRKIR